MFIPQAAVLQPEATSVSIDKGQVFVCNRHMWLRFRKKLHWSSLVAPGSQWPGSLSAALGPPRSCMDVALHTHIGPSLSMMEAQYTSGVRRLG